MAQTLQIQTTVRLSGDIDDSFGLSFNETPTAALLYKDVVTITQASDYTFSFGATSLPGWFMINSLDATNFFKVGPDATGMQEFARVLPLKGFGPIYIASGIVVKARADTADVQAIVRFYSDS